MYYFRHIISFLLILFPVVFVAIFGTKYGLESVIPSIAFYLWQLRDNNKIRRLTLQTIKERLNGEMVLISTQERIHLGPLMKDFIKQPLKIINATGNIDGLSLYKITEKMKRRLEII